MRPPVGFTVSVPFEDTPTARPIPQASTWRVGGHVFCGHVQKPRHNVAAQEVRSEPLKQAPQLARRRTSLLDGPKHRFGIE